MDKLLMSLLVGGSLLLGATACVTSNATSELPSSTVSAASSAAVSNAEVEMNRHIQTGKIPERYSAPATQQGTLENFSYTKADGTQSRAMVYLPCGYDASDMATRYNILYLQHGAYGNEQTWMVEYGDTFKNLIDHMIQDGLVEPLIIVMPYLPASNAWYQDTTPVFYTEEIRDYLMPAVESAYHTYAETTDDAGFTASRSHRAFGGFSAGGTTTWTVFQHGLDRFEYFMPLSGGLTLGGNGSSGEVADAQTLADVAVASGYTKQEYYIFAATGTWDVAYRGLTAQIDAMKTHPEAFDFTDSGFESGNLMYYTVQGNRHDYQYTYEYVYNGLQRLF